MNHCREWIFEIPCNEGRVEAIEFFLDLFTQFYTSSDLYKYKGWVYILTQIIGEVPQGMTPTANVSYSILDSFGSNV